MSLLAAGIVLLLFIWMFGEIADRLPEDPEPKGDGAHHRPKSYRFN